MLRICISESSLSVVAAATLLVIGLAIDVTSIVFEMKIHKEIQSSKSASHQKPQDDRFELNVYI